MVISEDPWHLDLDLGLSRLVFEHPIFHLRGESSNRRGRLDFNLILLCYMILWFGGYQSYCIMAYSC